MKAEKESAALYLEAAEKETDEKVKALLVDIAAEEQKHYNILENVYEFINAPSQALIWSESSRPENL
jgi:rubrerythrin